MTPLGYILVTTLLVEAFYLFYWLPRHWHELQECQDIALFLETVAENRRKRLNI